MGFRIEPTQYRLTFADTRLAGFQVLTKSVSIGEFMDITGLAAGQVITGVTLRDGVLPRDELLEAVAGVLVSWDLEDDNGPVKPSYEALRAQEPWVVRALVKAWMEAVSDADPNSGGGSASGPQSLAGLMQMEVASDVPES